MALLISALAYVHVPELAPTAEMLKTYRGHARNWAGYEKEFIALMQERRVEQTVPVELLDGGCLLCSEATPEHCHRRLVAEYMQRHLPGVEIHHLA